MSSRVPIYKPSILLIETVREKLKQRIKGQDLVINRLCDSLLSRSVRDYNDPRVLYVALLNGTSWCWKTTIAREFANIMNEELKRDVGKGIEFKFWKIDLGSYHSCEVPTLVWAFSSWWWANNGPESRMSKFEEIMEEVEILDPLFCRGCLLLDEADKSLVSDISNPSTAIDKLSEIFETASPLSKRKWAKQLRLNNFVIFLWANFFCNSRNKKGAKIGFSVASQEEEIEKDIHNPEPIDKEEIERKIKEYLTISSVNRFDDILIFENSFQPDVRKEILTKHFDEICENIRIHFLSFDPHKHLLPPEFKDPKADDYLEQVLAMSDIEGWIRSAKRTLELQIKPKIMEFYLDQLSPERKYLFIELQHEQDMERERKRIKHARMEMLNDDDGAIWPGDSNSNI